VLQYLPNCLTFSRLLLTLPLGLLIVRQEFGWALAVGLIAGITDALDGFAARRLQAFSRFGAALDPIADKLLVLVVFLSFAYIELIPWYLAAIVIGRDLIIVSGALGYHFLIGPFAFAPTRLSKLNMFLQISYCVLLLLAQVLPGIPAAAITAGAVIIIVIALASGIDYVLSWGSRAARENRNQR
tara:strand:+ start:78293 stop:78847 length:555 start_codon:yes stop_codon:yes gene_type:complete